MTSRATPPVAFLEQIHELASSAIVESLGELPTEARWQIKAFALRVLRGKKLKKRELLRSGAARLIVALLPETFPELEKLLDDRASPLWHEVHFIIFSGLDREDLGRDDQGRVIRLLRKYLTEISSDAGYAAWKAGDLLGDEWRDAETVQVLEDLVFSARHVAGRKGALHGIEEALRHANVNEWRRLLSLLERSASRDRSVLVRKEAQFALEWVAPRIARSSSLKHLQGRLNEAKGQKARDEIKKELSKAVDRLKGHTKDLRDKPRKKHDASAHSGSANVSDHENPQ